MPTEREDRLALADRFEKMPSWYSGDMTQECKLGVVTVAERDLIVAALRLYPVMEGMREALRSFCHAGGDLGCSCADRNYQWFDHACREHMVAAFRKQLNTEAALSAPHPQARGEERKWISPIETVADLVNDLLTLDQTMAVHGAYFIDDVSVKDRSRTRNLSLSLERVANNRIQSKDDSLPWSLVIWTNQARPSEATVGREAFTSLVNEMKGWLSCYATSMRAAAGNANFTVLQNRVELAEAALPALSPQSESLPASRNGVDTDGADRK